jgi:catechol 2,3-dioxygenase-like lactoylglutathione lyase family enzyme
VRDSELAEVALFTDRLDQGKRFYAQVLGRATASDWPGGATNSSGAVTILIHERGADTGAAPANQDHVAFAVVDLDAAYQELTAAGLMFEVAPKDLL